MCKRSVPRGLRFAILQKTIRRQMDEYVRETGLTGTQVGVLGELGRLERESAGEVAQKALEAAAHVTHPTMTELLKKLEKKGLCHLPHQRKGPPLQGRLRHREGARAASCHRCFRRSRVHGALPRTERGRDRGIFTHHRCDAGKRKKYERRAGAIPVRERM